VETGGPGVKPPGRPAGGPARRHNPPELTQRGAAGLASLESSVHFVTAIMALVQARLAGHFPSSSSTSLLHAPGEEKSAVPRN